MQLSPKPMGSFWPVSRCAKYQPSSSSSRRPDSMPPATVQLQRLTCHWPGPSPTSRVGAFPSQRAVLQELDLVVFARRLLPIPCFCMASSSRTAVLTLPEASASEKGIHSRSIMLTATVAFKYSLQCR